MNIVLVLGMCFFAGGLRFKEQGFDASENDITLLRTALTVTVVLVSSCDANSFFALEHQRWGCSYACSVPLLSELANRYNINRSESCYFKYEPWCKLFVSRTGKY
jgi:Ca2+/H+ antiporter